AERTRVAADGEALARERSFAAEWVRIKGVVESEWEGIQAHHHALPPLADEDLLLLRSWQALGAQSPEAHPVAAELEAALASPTGPAWPALALTALSRGQDWYRSARWLHAAFGKAQSSPLVALGLVEALFQLGEGNVAADGARRLLGSLL